MVIKAILFDLDDTLIWDERSVREAFQATCQYAFHSEKVNPDVLELAVRAEASKLYESYETYSFTKMIGINPFEALWANFTGGNHPEFRMLQSIAPHYRIDAWTRGLKTCGIDQPKLAVELAELFYKERRLRPIVFDETFAVLNQLRSKYDLLLLTNGAPDLQNEKINMVPELRSYFKHIVISGEFGEGKPSSALFNHACSLLGIDSSEGIMIGDKLTTDILGSNLINMKNIWINHHRINQYGNIQPMYEVLRLADIIPIINQFA